MELANWTIEYVKAKNAFHRTLKEYMQEGNEITFMHKHKIHHFFISPKLSVPEPKDFYTTVCLQTEENMKFLSDNWDKFLHENYWVLFVNPDENTYWQISPHTHNKIADPETLEEGFKALGSDVKLEEGFKALGSDVKLV